MDNRHLFEQAGGESNGMKTPSASTHPLDFPIWTALTTRQQVLAEGGALARRYPPAMAPFAAIADTSAESFAALQALMAPSDRAVLFTPEPVVPPRAFEVEMAASGDQMVGAVSGAVSDGHDIVTLGAADAPAMMDLVDLTKPGPFYLRTHELGTFLGIKIEGRLVAMAGERMKPGGYTEMTAVCTHPDHRGRGYAQAVLGAISQKISARGEMPFLHVFSENAPAIALYRRLGLSIRRRLHVTVLALRA